jgi:putative phage-type endonuclease
MTLTKEQQEMRMAGPGGSEIGAALGMSKFSSPLQVYLRLTGQLAEQPVTEDMDRGTFLEPGMRGWYEKKKGRRVVEVGTVRGPKPFMVVSPDGLVLKPSAKAADADFAAVIGGSEAVAPHSERGLEIKVPGPYQGVDWGEPGSDEVPAEHWFQAAWGMACVGLDAWDVAALLQGRLEIYTVYRDPEVEAMMVDRVAAFMRDYVEKRVPPKATWCKRDAEWVQKKYPRQLKPLLTEAEVPADAQKLLGDLQTAYKQWKGWGNIYKGRAAAVQAFLGENEGLLLTDGGKVTWRAPEKPKADYKAAYHRALKALEDIANDPKGGELGARALAAWTECSEGLKKAGAYAKAQGRRFLVPRAWGGISEGNEGESDE